MVGAAFRIDDPRIKTAADSAGLCAFSGTVSERRRSVVFGPLVIAVTAGVAAPPRSVGAETAGAHFDGG